MRHSHETGASGISDAEWELFQIAGSQTAVHFADSESGNIRSGHRREKEELKEAAKAEEQRHIAETNQKMQQEQFHMTCPVCGSRSVQKISAVGKYAKIGVLGILGADDLGKTWKCTVCGSKF